MLQSSIPVFDYRTYTYINKFILNFLYFKIWPQASYGLRTSSHEDGGAYCTGRRVLRLETQISILRERAKPSETFWGGTGKGNLSGKEEESL